MSFGSDCSRLFAAFSCLALSTACPAPPAQVADSGAAEVAASQPGSQPSSASSIPDEHDTSTVAVSIAGMFKMPESPEVIAKVNAREIKRSDLEQRLRQMQIQLGATGVPETLTRFDVLNGAVDELITLALRRELGESLGVVVDPKMVAAWQAELEERMEASPPFKAFILRAGKDEEQRAKDAYDAVLMDGIVTKIRDSVKDDLEKDARAYYDAHKADYTEREGREVWRIFVAAPKGMIQRDRDAARSRADDINAKVKKNPKEFENIAKSTSEGGKGRDGGYLGWLAKGTLAAEIEDQIWAAKTNSILPMHEDPRGFYIYKVGKERKQRTLPFEEVRGPIVDQIFGPRIGKRIDQDLEALRAKQKIEIFIPELDKLKALQPKAPPAP